MDAVASLSYRSCFSFLILVVHISAIYDKKDIVIAGLSVLSVYGGAELARADPYVSPKYPIRGTEDIMKPKAHGTSDKPVQTNLRWGCDVKLADRICN